MLHKKKLETKALTLRNISPDVLKIIYQKADKENISINKAVSVILEESLNIFHKKEKATYHDLDALAGCWTKEESIIFDKSLQKQRKIDLELWENA